MNTQPVPSEPASVRDKLEFLLAMQSSTRTFACGSSVPSRRGRHASKTLDFPVNTAIKARIVTAAIEAGIGSEDAPPGGNVINREARVTYKILPNQMKILNEAEFA
ncbi:hypothetical protein TrLO_g2632 [Triparma laevis f. longispina]|uniref:Uncharacterized protein n=1 Tax=Triparma laevis f. longispina TaxID=1714387 RepID=A0A9W7KUT0_9STRA|nr:hypothetical protein TrLO_g2632 [Triparma laevis f. longispina]